VLNANGYPQRLIVVGGGSEIAAAIVEALAEGPLERVALLGPRPATLARTKERLAASVKELETFPLDLAETTAIPGALEPAIAWLEQLDSAIVAAGVLPDQHEADHDPALVARVFQINATGAAVALTVLAERFERQGYGQLIVLSSVAATVVRRRSYLYDASKAALDRFALGLADRLEPATRVHVVRPVYVRTKMTEGRAEPPFVLSAEQVARATLAGIRSHRRVIWVPAPARLGIAALSLLPRPILRRLPI